MDEGWGEESLRLRPAGAGAALAVACLCLAILYNALVGQEGRVASAPPDPGGGVAKMEVDAGESQLGTVSLHYDPVVEAVQRELAAAGFYDGPVDGVAGKQTRSAIETWQSVSGMDVTGEATQDLADRIAFNRTIAEAAAPTGSLDAPAADERVAMVQTGLAELGYLPGLADGQMGEQTREAIRQFERDRRMAETGDVSDALMAELAKTSGQSSLSPD